MRLLFLLLLSGIGFSLAFGQTVISSGSAPLGKENLGSPVVFEFDISELTGELPRNLNKSDLLNITCQKIDLKTVFVSKIYDRKNARLTFGFTFYNAGDHDLDTRLILREKGNQEIILSTPKKEVEEGKYNTIKGFFKIPKSDLHKKEKYVLAITWIVK